MSNEPPQPLSTTHRAELAKTQSSKGRRVAAKFLSAALGAIPWVGGFIAAASIRADEAAVKGDDLRTQWLEEHEASLTSSVRPSVRSMIASRAWA